MILSSHALPSSCKMTGVVKSNSRWPEGVRSSTYTYMHREVNNILLCKGKCSYSLGKNSVLQKLSAMQSTCTCKVYTVSWLYVNSYMWIKTPHVVQHFDTFIHFTNIQCTVVSRKMAHYGMSAHSPV